MSVQNFVNYNQADLIIRKIAKKINALDGALHYRGTITFANIPATITKAMVGYIYNISDSFTTDARFVEGAGKIYPAGTDIEVADQSTYEAVTPVGSENPVTEGWYEYDATVGKYLLSTDTTVDNQKTYYSYNESIMLDVGIGFINTGAINDRIDAVRDSINDNEFDRVSGTYVIGDIVTYEDKLYKFKAAHTAGDPWDATEVDEVTVLDLISSAEPDSLTQAQLDTLITLLS